MANEGWYDYTPEPFNKGALEVYYWSMDRGDLARVQENEWVRFLEGKNADYPVAALQEDLAEVRERTGKVRADSTSPDTRMSDDMNGFNPAMVSRLTELMLGGLPTERLGFPLHCRVRYFDLERQRAGMPEDVGALVESMSAGRDEPGLGQHRPGRGAYGRRPGGCIRGASVRERNPKR